MESPSTKDLIQCCDCGCHSSPRSFHRSVKRRHDELLDESNNPKVHIENECELLRETVTSQQQSIQELYEELEKERNAAASAADESMNVMQRLQNEKAELQMELRQYKLYVGEKMEHDLQEMVALEELVNQREQTIMALTCEAQAYKHRMMSYGLTEGEAEGDKSGYNSSDGYDLTAYEYPPLKCNVVENHDPLGADVYSPRPQRHFRRMSTKEVRTDAYNVNAKDDSSDIGDDRVYTIDSVTEQKLEAETSDGNVGFQREQMDLGDPDITKLYMRLQALEADRESMKQALVSMRTEKAQMVLLKEIAQHLSKEVVPQRRLPLRKASTGGPLPFTPVFKWISSFVSWRRKARRSKYMYGMSANNMGLQMLLEKVPRSRKWRCLRSTQV
ncbi:BnaA05g27250D [Brassica napus]|uniref:BnaA05g27250D protein n=1 Tax=Brassica napus TaxID=3708 RepID=A0A078F609_BRANA|nr:BnaA05g27250D [Brassica napus]